MNEFYLAMDLGGTSIKSALFTSDFSLVAENRLETNAHEGAEIVLKRMILSLNQLLASSQITPSQIKSLGVGVPGLLDRHAGISIFSPNFQNWENVPVAALLERELGIATFIDNDVRMNLYGECQFGSGQDKKNVVLLTLGTGLGAGVMIDGNILYGTTGSVGEIGHMNMYRQGRECRCGSSGCLGRYVSALGLLRTVREKIQAGQQSILSEWVNHDLTQLTAQQVSKAYDEKDSVALAAFKETGEILGFGLANVINLYNPETIIIGGGMSAAGERLLATTRETVSAHALQLSQATCNIVLASLGDAAGMYGAAFYAKRESS